LVDAELLWAVRARSAGALAYWWDAALVTVLGWRKAFGVGRRGTDLHGEEVAEPALGR
jgi:hypothetical protein